MTIAATPKPMIDPGIFARSAKPAAAKPPASDEPVTMLPPHSGDMELALLGALLSTPGAMAAILADGFNRESFFIVRNQMVYDAMLSLHTDGIAIDSATVANWLDERGKLVEVGGYPRLSEALIISPIAGAGAVVYAKVVTDYADSRRLLSLAPELARLAYDPELSAAKKWSRAQKLLSDGQPVNRDLAFVHGSQSINIHTKMLEDQCNRPSWLSVPFKALAERVPVINTPDIVTIAGPEGSGKSALLATWAQFYAEQYSIRTCYIHTEMSKKQVLDRRIVLNTPAVPYAYLTKPDQMPDQGWVSILDANMKIEGWAKYLDYWEAETVDEEKLLSVMQGMVDRLGTRVFVIDYLNDVIPEEKRNQNNANAWRLLLARLEAFNRKNGTVILTAAQLNADGNAYMIGRALHQKSAIYLKIEPEELKFEHTFKFQGVDQVYVPGDFHPEIQLNIVKYRAGGRGKIKLLFVGSRYLWTDIPTFAPRPLSLGGTDKPSVYRGGDDE